MQDDLDSLSESDDGKAMKGGRVSAEETKDLQTSSWDQTICQQCWYFRGNFSCDQSQYLAIFHEAEHVASCAAVMFLIKPAKTQRTFS